MRRHPGLGPSRSVAIAATCLLLLGGEVASGADTPYAPYRFLIGSWDIAPESGGPPMARAVFRWGPNQSYIWSSGSFLVKGSEVPHFEGLLVWNGVRKNLDMLLSLDLEGGRVQEQGTMFVEADGTVVRDITAFYSEGARPIGQAVTGPAGSKARFRQTFHPAGSNRVRTRVLRQVGNDWVATFPGSDHLVMIRRSKA